MYLPYLRGRQFELIALREMVENNLLNGRIIPIIEPVKLSSTLIKTMETFNSENKKLAIITNPDVGKFFEEKKEEKNKDLSCKYDYFIDNHSNLIFINILSSIKESYDFRNIFLGRDVGLIFKNFDSINIYNNVFNATDKINFHFIPDDIAYRGVVNKNVVLLEDRFLKQRRNDDYSKNTDEFYSLDHLFYKKYNYIGFSDYSMIGEEYSETGFAPYAIVIHIVYFDNNKYLRIKHFVSDSNFDLGDPSKKFREALKKLVDWNSKEKIDTYGIRKFVELYNNGAYPGLGVVKKLSLMHHLELMGKFFDGKI